MDEILISALREIANIATAALQQIDAKAAPPSFKLLVMNKEKPLPPKYLDGNFRQRGNVLEYRFCLDCKQVSVTGKTQQDCWDKRTAMIKAGKKQSSTQMTYGEWVNKWSALYTKGKDNYKKEVQRYIERDIVPAIGKYKLNKLDGIMLQEYLTGIIAANSRGKIAGIISRSLIKAFKLQLIKRNPYDAVELERNIVEHYRPLEYTEQTLIYDSIDVEVYRSAFMFLCCTGLRVGELCALDFNKDIDYSEQIINVIESRDIGTKALVGTKTKKSKRKVPFASTLLPYIETLKNYNENVRQITYPAVSSYFKRLYEQLKLKDLTLHSFRHTFMSVGYAADIKEKTLQSLAGHAQLSTTMDIYTHLLKKGGSIILDYMKTLALSV